MLYHQCGRRCHEADILCQEFMTFLGRSASGADLSERNSKGQGWCGAIQSWKVSISQPAISTRPTRKAAEAYSLEPSLKQVEAVKRCQEVTAPRARRHYIDQSQVGAGEHPAAWPARPESHSALPDAKAIVACWNSPVHSCSLCRQSRRSRDLNLSTQTTRHSWLRNYVTRCRRVRRGVAVRVGAGNIAVPIVRIRYG